MRILHRYLLVDFLVLFFTTLAVVTFVMSLGAVIRAIDLGSRGISGVLIFKVFAYNIPYLMSFTIPISVLTGVLLLFGRLSFDGELTAMKAGGLGIWQIVSPVVLCSILLATVCLFINATLAPVCRYAVRVALVELGMEEPVNLLEPGRFVREFPGLMVYVGERSGNRVTDVVVYEMGKDGPVRNVRAKQGLLRADNETKALLIDLYDVRIDERQKDKKDGAIKSQYINAEHYPVRLDFSAHRKQARKKNSDLTLFEILQTVRDIRTIYPELKRDDLLRQRMNLVVEANKRLALAVSCFAFTLLAIPLGMRSKRKESSVGIGLALLLVFAFYLFIILANALVATPHLRPDLIVWIPVVLGEVLGFALLRRVN